MEFCDYMSKRTDDYYKLIKERDEMISKGLDTSDIDKRIASLDSILGHFNDNMDLAKTLELPARVTNFHFGIVDYSKKNVQVVVHSGDIIDGIYDGKYRKRKNTRERKRS